MCCLDIVGMIISPCPSHPFGILVVWHDVVVLSEFLVTDSTYPVLRDNLAIQQFPHLCGGSEFPISSWVVRILNALDAQPHPTFLPNLLPTTAEHRSVDRTEFIATEFHGLLLNGALVVWLIQNRRKKCQSEVGLTY